MLNRLWLDDEFYFDVEEFAQIGSHAAMLSAFNRIEK